MKGKETGRHAGHRPAGGRDPRGTAAGSDVLDNGTIRVGFMVHIEVSFRLGRAQVEQIIAQLDQVRLKIPKEQLAAMLTDRGSLVDGRWRGGSDGEIEIPATVQALLWARLDALDASSRAVVDRASGAARPLSANLRQYAMPRLSPDGKRLAVEIQDSPHQVWMLDIERDVLVPLTTEATGSHNFAWSPDGTTKVLRTPRCTRSTNGWDVRDLRTAGFLRGCGSPSATVSYFRTGTYADVICSGEFTSPRRRSPAYRAPGKQR